MPSAINWFFVLVVVASSRAATLHPSFRQENECPVVLSPDTPLTRAVIRTPPDSNLRTVQRNGTFTIRIEAPRIVNGDFIQSDNLREVMVALVDLQPDPPSWCTGTLISPSWVLSAAHCELPLSTIAAVGTTQVDVSSSPLRLPEGEVIRVGAVFNHPNYVEEDPSLRANDIAAVRLIRPASTRLFMRLNFSPNQPKTGSFSRVTGYGTTIFMESEPINDLGRIRQVDVPIFSTSACNQRYQGVIFADRHLCAGYTTRSCDSCQGDSGGPLFQYDENNNPVMMGIVSFGRGCGEPNVPGVYVRTSPFRSFLESVGAEFTEGTNIRSVFNFDSLQGIAPSIFD